MPRNTRLEAQLTLINSAHQWEVYEVLTWAIGEDTTYNLTENGMRGCFLSEATEQELIDYVASL